MRARSPGVLSRLRGDEGGAIAVIAALCLTIIVFAAALAVDIGGRVQELRRDQATADLAALDTSRALTSDATALAAAQASVGRNNLDLTNTANKLTVTRGSVTNGVFTAGGTNTAVKVTVGTPYNDFFGGTSATLSASAVASMVGEAQFSIGSTLAEVNVGLARFGSAQLDAVGYNGLVSGNVTLQDLGTSLGFSGLSADQVLASNVSVGDLVQASSSLLGASNPTAAASLTALFGALATNLTTNSFNKATIGEALGLQQGQGVALGTYINLFQAFRGSLEVANQKAGIALSLGVPNVAGLALTGLVPATVSPYGPVGITATNTQVTITFNLGVSTLLATATLPITLTLGGATGTLHAIDCTSNVVSDIKTGTVFQSAVLTVAPATVTLLGLGGGTGQLSGTISVDYASPGNTTVSKPANWADNAAGTPAHVAATGSPTVTSHLGASGLTAAVVNSLFVAIPSASIVTGAITSLAGVGINVGPAADYLGIQADCGGFPRLVS